MYRNSDQAWGGIAIILHWLMLSLIVIQVALGWTADSWRLSPTKIELFVWHKSTGILLLLLAVLRIGWRLANQAPSPPKESPRWEQVTSTTGHVVLYLLLVAIPLSGWVINSAANIPLNVYWLFPLPDITQPSKQLAELAAHVHFDLLIALSAGLCLHIGAAVRHHFIRRNNVLLRMLPDSWS